VDILDWFIATLHQMIGHDKTAQVIGAPAGDKRVCILCRFERSIGEFERSYCPEMLTEGEETG